MLRIMLICPKYTKLTDQIYKNFNMKVNNGDRLQLITQLTTVSLCRYKLEEQKKEEHNLCFGERKLPSNQCALTFATILPQPPEC